MTFEMDFNKEVDRRMQASKARIAISASVAVLADGHILMGRRRDSGKWTCPGGHAKPNELPFVAGLRELREETGIFAHSLKDLGYGISGKTMVYCYEFQAPAICATETHQDPDQEVLAWQWVPISGGLPEEVKANLHHPKNLLLMKLGLL